VAIQADADSAFMQFLAQQSGLPAEQLQTPAIKFGGTQERNSRLILLLCDAGGHPIRVIKVGLNSSGRAATQREANLLSQLPEGVIGCTGITGSFSSDTLSAFATAYFSGTSLDNDVGIEKLFHDWLNDEPPEPIQNLAIWQELESAIKDTGLAEWPHLRNALAHHNIRTTIYHGDFAPWNVRMTNLENIRAFDWERGDLKGIPAWDWFHFIVQTSILVKRHSPERVAAELEQLTHSPRFQKYANEAGISEILEPLLLAYLLGQKLIVQPREGGELADRLFRLLWARWQLKINAGKRFSLSPTASRTPPGEQIKFAFAKLANLLWEPQLSPLGQPPLTAQLRRYWLVMLAALVWICGFATLHVFTCSHLLFTPFYLAPCMLLALKTDRRLGFMAAFWGGFAGPAFQLFKVPSVIPFNIICWNIYMRTLVFLLVVILLDRVRKQNSLGNLHPASSEPSAIQAISGNWAVVLITSIFFILVMVLDGLTNPNLIFFPLYLLPCVIFTLALNRRWGTLAALLASVVGPLLQRPGDPEFQLLSVEFWNTLMRFAVFEMVVMLLDRIRRDNILFHPKIDEQVFGENRMVSG
jgi:hypothetical protein